ncbi:TIM barrel protein [Actinomadura verrucosospora]|uniref:2-keto-myo-inositol dehydratase n=1 Tax=Actinomadura verrucosospora TaxID=46165 RepID=A0A7D3ZN52_ACTVE|nr:TIM barrel protein [Actinomadura verrucosospora]QKG24541.1 2-keto-myo-inositol dehydratase [Actinomadura verrucosospora]
MIKDRVAGAPISWGVCEVPGWGHQMAPARVLAEMGALGLAATEFGPDGFLPAGAAERAELLAAHGLRPLGGFAPVVLHDPARDPLPEIRRTLAAFGVERSKPTDGDAADGAAADSGLTLVLAAVHGLDGYDERPALDAAGWAALLANLDRIAALAAEAGVRAVLHPHVGTMVERADEVQRVLDGSGIPLCLDTGHLLIGGVDPSELAARVPERIAHVHLKDVDAGLAADVQDGRIAYTDAVRKGIYRPLGGGDIDIAGIVGSLEGAGYRGWYVLEQDTILDREPDEGAGPAADVRACLDFLAGIPA